MFDTPCVSTPRRSVVVRTSAPSAASSGASPILLKISVAVLRSAASDTKTWSFAGTLKRSSMGAFSFGSILAAVTTNRTPRMVVHRSGHGPDLVLFHGGMGSWKHWIRNVEPLAERFTVHALDHPGYGDSEAVPRETTGRQYLEVMRELFARQFPGRAPLRFAGFSFGGAIAAHLARRLAPRVTHLCLVSPAGFPARKFGERPTRSYREAGDDDARFREICRHNLLINMLSDPASVTEETIDIQAYCVRHTRFNSRKVSGGGTLLDDLAHLPGRVRVLWGEGDDSPFRPADLLIGEIRAAVGELDLHRIPKAGHWSAYENAPEVNRRMLEFFSE